MATKDVAFARDDFRLCKDEMPEFLPDFAKKTVWANDMTLVYKKGNVKGRCMQCGEEVTARNERFLSWKKTYCPNCWEEVRCIPETNNSVRYVGNVVTVEKGTDGKTVFFRQWQIQRDAFGEGGDIKQYIKEVVRYAIRGKHTAKWQQESKEPMYYNCGRYDTGGWEWFSNNRIYDYSHVFCDIGVAEAIADTPMQYADWEGYLEYGGDSKNLIYFLQYHAKYPVIEFLHKGGYERLLHQRIWGMDQKEAYAILWQRKNLKECFRFPMRYLKIFSPELWTMRDVLQMNRLYAEFGDQVEQTNQYKAFVAGLEYRYLEHALEFAPFGKVKKYLLQQARKSDGAEDTHSICIAYRDYLNECDVLELDLQDKQILFPPNLMEAHRGTSSQISFAKNMADQRKFAAAVKIMEQYCYEKGEYLIRPAREQMEVQMEGTTLRHCVAGYLKQIANQESMVFFIRKKSAPEECFYTLELQGGEIKQCRTYQNVSYTRNPEIEAFVGDWMKRVVKKIKPENYPKTA